MSLAIRIWSVVLVATLFLADGAGAAPVRNQAQKLQAIDRMMASLAAESAADAAAIKRIYRDHLAFLVLSEYTDLEAALANGGLAPLPDDVQRFNLAPRLEGLHPIGEKDLDNQTSYISARPATIGALLDIASRVKSGPLEITSLVRHDEYQGSLRATNPNATTPVPTHTMGLAVDIALINTPLETVYEIRDVLRQMRADGDILVIGERKQLVFHVVPHPSRLGHFTDVYMKAVGSMPTLGGAHVVAAAPAPRVERQQQRTAEVTTDVVAVAPQDQSLQDAWWNRPAATTGEVAAPPPAAPEPEDGSVPWRWVGVLAGALMVTWRLAARR